MFVGISTQETRRPLSPEAIEKWSQMHDARIGHTMDLGVKSRRDGAALVRLKDFETGEAEKAVVKRTQ